MDRKRWRDLRDNWNRVSEGMTLADAEAIMGFKFDLDSKNAAGRLVYSHHTSDFLPFYLVVNKESGLIVRRHRIRALDEMI